MFFSRKEKLLSDDNDYYVSKSKQKKKKTRSLFSKFEDEHLTNLVEKYGDSDWSLIADNMNGRTIRQCRERWLNNLSSAVVKSKWTEDEDDILTQKYLQFGPKWKKLEQFFTGRTSYNIRNRWKSISKGQKHPLYTSKIDNNHLEICSNSVDEEINLQLESKNDCTSNLGKTKSDSKLEVKNDNEKANNQTDINISNDDDIFNDLFSGFLFSCDENIFF